MSEKFIDENEVDDKYIEPSSSIQILRSELAQEIISRKPDFLEKWSLLIFLGILLILLGSTWFIHYPDVVTTSAVLTSKNAPKELVSKQGGYLLKIFVKDNQQVKQNEVVAIIGSAANRDTISLLLKKLEHAAKFLTDNQPQKIASIANVTFNNLGEIQSNYERFLIAEDDFLHYISKKTNLQKVTSRYIVDKQRIKFENEIKLLKSEIVAWEEKYTFKSPFDGTISISDNIKQGDYLSKGKLLAYILPRDEEYFIETVLPQDNFGKLDTGLRVQIRFDAYPYEEWGYLDGTLSYISKVSSSNGFRATIRLNHKTTTSNKNKLIFRNGLRAQALIITKDIRLFTKLYYGLYKSASAK